MTQSFVYALLDPRSDEVRYIGISINPAQRFASHLYESRKDTRTRKRAWIRSLLAQDLEPVFSVIRDLDTDIQTLAQLEIDCIAEYVSEGHDLTNITLGGEGTWGFSAPRTEEWCKKLSEATRAYQASLTADEKSARSEKRLNTILLRNNGIHPGYTKGKPSPHRGRVLSDETKAKMREAHKRRWARIHAEGRYEEVCANIATGTKRAQTEGNL